MASYLLELSNALRDFIWLMNQVLHLFINKFIVFYFNDILISFKIIVPITEYIKKLNNFVLIKEKLNIASMLPFLNFDKLFEIKCDACSIGNRDVFLKWKDLWYSLVRN